MNSYTAIAKNKQTKEYTVITSTYKNKQNFIRDLRRNGYSVNYKMVYTTADWKAGNLREDK